MRRIVTISLLLCGSAVLATRAAEPLYDGAARLFNLPVVTVVYPLDPAQGREARRLSAERRAAYLAREHETRVAVTSDEAISEESFLWYVKNSVTLITSVAVWLEEMKQELGTYDYLKEVQAAVDTNALDLLDWSYLQDSKSVLCGSPDRVVEAAKAYEQAGVDLLLCLVNPYKVPHAQVMQTIELMGKHVLPEFA